MTSGELLAIYTAAGSREPVSAQQKVQVRMGCGIVGDRHFRARGYRPGAPPNQITLIEQEAVAAFNQQHGVNIAPGELRRNLLTGGVDLNALVGCDFHVGAVRLRGIELCEPCAVIGKLLQRPGLGLADVVRSLVGHGGLRAEILDDGVIGIGDRITADLSGGRA